MPDPQHELYLPTGMGDPWATRRLGQHALETLKVASRAYRAAAELHYGSKPHVDYSVAAAALAGRASGLISAYQLSHLDVESAAKLCTRVNNLILDAAKLPAQDGDRLLADRFPGLDPVESPPSSS